MWKGVNQLDYKGSYSFVIPLIVEYSRLHTIWEGEAYGRITKKQV